LGTSFFPLVIFPLSDPALTTGPTCVNDTCAFPGGALPLQAPPTPYEESLRML
jgi:hypothetical protein